MSLKFITAVLLILSAAAPPLARGQSGGGMESTGSSGVSGPVSEIGLMNGSGMAFLPGSGTTPATHWRVRYHRINYLRPGFKGMNVMGLDYGLSSNVEGYVRLTGEQLGTVSSLAAYAFGGKLVLPFTLPVALSTVLWFESSSTDELHRSVFFPARTFRAGAAFSPHGNGIGTQILFGLSSTEKGSHFMAGGGMSVAVGHAARFSLDAVTGYGEAWGVHLGGSVSVTVLPHIGIVAGTGYLEAPTATTWMLSAGISVSTADIDFNPGPALRTKEEFTLPSLDDIMKEPSGGNQDE